MAWACTWYSARGMSPSLVLKWCFKQSLGIRRFDMFACWLWCEIWAAVLFSIICCLRLRSTPSCVDAIPRC